MSRLINSFDVFDTLIARRRIEPRRVLEMLEARAKVPGLAAARIIADQTLGTRGQPYTLSEIWQEVRRTIGLDDITAAPLMDLEIQIEHEEVIPVVENLALVRDGDLLVSDTYLPPEVVRSLLRRAGLTEQVGLVITNDGKFRGWVWAKLLEHVAIAQHFGDNPHSDGKTPSAAGIKAVIYTGAQPSSVERILIDRGLAPLASLAREARLVNPFSDSCPHQRHLWLATCQLNFPLLYLASLELERHAEAADAREVFFVSRDGLLWHQLYQALFPHRRSTYLYGSRKCLLKPTADYLAYFCRTWHPNGLIVDLFSTGASWSRLCAHLEAKARLFVIGRVDNYAYVRGGPSPDEWLDIAAVFRTSEFGSPLSKGVEMLNYAPHAVVEDVTWLPGNVALPVLAEKLEYDASLPTAAHQAFKLCIDRLPLYPDLPRSSPDGATDLIKTLVRFICADPRLPAIYPNHQTADTNYLQAILG